MDQTVSVTWEVFFQSTAGEDIFVFPFSSYKVAKQFIKDIMDNPAFALKLIIPKGKTDGKSVE